MTPTNQPGSVQATLNALQADLARERAYSAGLERELAEANARVREMEKAGAAAVLAGRPTCTRTPHKTTKCDGATVIPLAGSACDRPCAACDAESVATGARAPSPAAQRELFDCNDCNLGD